MAIHPRCCPRQRCDAWDAWSQDRRARRCEWAPASARRHCYARPWVQALRVRREARAHAAWQRSHWPRRERQPRGRQPSSPESYGSLARRPPQAGVRRPCSRPPSSRPQPLRPSSLWRPSRPRRVGRHGAAHQHRLAVECGRPVRLQWTPRGSTRRYLVFGRDRVTLCSLDRVLWRARVLESSSAPKRSLNSRARTTCEHSYLFFHNC